MTTLETLNEKLDTLGGEMKTQTQQLGRIEVHAGAMESHTRTMATVATADQEARDRIYDRLAEGLIKMARVIAVGMLMILVLSVIATFKQEIHATFGDRTLNIGQSEKPR